MLLTNTATKLFFRASERRSLDIFDSLAPLVCGERLIAMAPGECYAALGDERFERRQLGMFPEGPAPQEGEVVERSANGADADALPA